MGRVVVSRLAQAALLLLVVSVVTFALLRLSPGDPAAFLYGQSASPAEVAQVRERWGLDAPIHVQYLRWLSNVLTGDLGRSYVDGRPVLTIIGDRIPATLELTLAALLIASVTGIAVGLLSARWATPRLARMVAVVTSIFYSTPPFWLGILLIMIFSLRLGWLPPGGYANPTADTGIGGLVAHMVLPVLALASRDAARFARVTRASVLAVASQDYVRTAVAKGLPAATVDVRHVLRNAVLPVAALFGVAVPGLLSGAVVVETVFAWPGMGRLVIESALQRNYPVITAEVLLVAAMAMIGSLLSDLVCAAADPRVRRPSVRRSKW